VLLLGRFCFLELTVICTASLVNPGMLLRVSTGSTKVVNDTSGDISCRTDHGI